MATIFDEKKTPDVLDPSPTSRSPSIGDGSIHDPSEEREVFQKDVDGVNFRTGR